jgi:hypothetical protein
MKYLNCEQTICVGDHVLYSGTPGVIVFVIDDDRYSVGYEKEGWAYLGKGLGLELQDGNLFHMDAPDEDLEPVI